MDATTTPPVPPYDALGAQLRATPCGKGAPAASPAELLAADNHCAWVAGLLKLDENSRSSLAKSCLLYPQEDGTFDVVRGSVAAGGVTVATASSRHVLCVSVAVTPNPQAAPAVLAAAAAKSLFDLPATAFVFREMGCDGNVHYGVRDFGVTKRLDPDWPHWGDALAWWCDGQQATFITTKVPGGPTQEVIAPSAEQNRYWFSQADKSRAG